MKDDLVIEFNKVCRTCLSAGEIKYLYETCNTEICLVEKLMLCTFVTFEENDGLPQYICTKCIDEIEKAYSFAQKCYKSDQILRQHYKIPEVQLKNKEKIIKRNINKQSELLKKLNKNSEKLTSNNANFLHVELKEEITESNCVDQSQFSDENNDVDDDTNNVLDEYDNKNKEIRTERTNKLKTYECKKCLETFSNITLLRQHFKTEEHLKNDYPRVPCSVCSKLFKKKQLKLHIQQVHSKERPFECSICGKKFPLKNSLPRHMRTHTGERPHQCQLCGKAFIQKPKLTEHLRKHSGEKAFICNQCGDRFVHTWQLQQHLKKHERNSKDDPKARNYKCTMCERAYLTRNSLKIHMLTHGDKNYLCSVCGKSFATPGNLYIHSRKHGNLDGSIKQRLYPCTICNKNFSQICTLKRHQLIHTGEKPFPCNLCNKTFSQRAHLKTHLTIHSGERNFECSICSKKFTTNGNLTIHMRTHTGETPYVCSICGRGFYDSSSMKKHQKGHDEKGVKILS